MNLTMNPIKRIKRKFAGMNFSIQTMETVMDYLINSPTYQDSDVAGFNGQMFRKRIFAELIKNFKFETIIETGTYTGNTTGYMAKLSSLPVYTCESNKIYHSLAKKRLNGISNIDFILGDSCEFLRELVKRGVCEKNSFIYLDAHWHEHLPLREEIEIICDNWKDFVIMIDDFQVPGDSGYGYDDYGRKKVLSLQCFGPTITKYDLVPFFPTLRSADESGSKRGCVILSKRGATSAQIDTLKVLTSRAR